MLVNFQEESLISLATTSQTFLFQNDFQSLLPEIFLVTAVIFLLVYGVVFSTSKEKNYPLLLTNISWLSLLACILTFGLLLNSPVENAILCYNTLIIDDFTTFLKGLVLFSSFFCIFMSSFFNKFCEE